MAGRARRRWGGALSLWMLVFIGCGDDVGTTGLTAGGLETSTTTSGDTAGPTCPLGLLDCGLGCVDPDVDRNNCGGCGMSCAPGEVCNGFGACALSCQSGLVQCGDSCVDPDTDENFCGASGDCVGPNAGTVCEAGQLCNGVGECALTCQAGLVACDGACIDPNTDQTFCGATGDCQGSSAGITCEPGQVCDGAGSCALACQAGLIDCGATCVDPNTDEAFCGASGDCQGPNAGVACDAGQICDGAGSCALSCQAGLIDCGGTCIDPDTDEAFCGASGDCQGPNAGATCVAGQICDGAGACALSCQSGLIDCGGACVDPDTDETFCGASGDCLGPNAGTMCLGGEVCNGSGTCALSCQSGLIDCGGTCVNPDTDETFCGASGDCSGPNAGMTCQAGEVCNGSGMCALSCQPGLVDCGGTCIDPVTNPNFCGASGDCQGPNAGFACGGSEACVGAVCISLGWTCDPALFGAGDAICNCGCGLPDPDCADSLVASCTSCNDPGSCDVFGGGCPGVLNLVQNHVCVAVCEDGPTSPPPCTTMDPTFCSCLGCVDNGTCDPAEDDCVCPDCVADPFCSNAANCVDNGLCDPFNEGCVCIDCALNPACTG